MRALANLGVFEPFFFTREIKLSLSPFIKAMHPKSEIKAHKDAIERILQQGWWGQPKIHGHRAQIHLASDTQPDVLVYTRKGGLHKKPMPAAMANELYRLLGPQKGYTVLDAEWVKKTDKLYLFDILKREGQLLQGYTYAERYAILPQVYKSELIETLPVIKTAAKCLKLLASNDPMIEGLVFKSSTSKGFSDTSVIRCRKKTSPY